MVTGDIAIECKIPAAPQEAFEPNLDGRKLDADDPTHADCAAAPGLVL